MKKAAAVFLTVLMIIITALPMCASAVVVSLDDGLKLNPGNTRNPNPIYNFAWLDQLFVRNDATAVVPATLIPKPDDYPYSLTYDEFIEECDRYIALNELDEDSVDNIYSALVEMVYYTVVSAGMTDNFDKMCAVLTRNGIELPDEATNEDKMKIGIVFSALEYNAIYALYGKETDIPAGITLDAAYVLILGALTQVNVPSGVDTVTGLGLEAVKQYLGNYVYIPLSKNPSTEELFYFLKVAVITENEGNVPLTKYSKVTADDKEYVDYTYFAKILEMAFEVPINPEALYFAYESSDTLAVHRLVLETMLDEKGVSYSETATVEKLFNKACKNGYFALESEFYGDVLNYELEVAPSCEKIWFTPITLGNQLNGGNKAPITVYLQGIPMEPGATAAAALDKTKTEEIIFLEVNYNDSNRNETALYEFRIIKNPELETTSSGTGPVDKVQDFVNSVVPTGNEKASEIIGSVFDGINSGVDSSNASGYIQDVLSTYGDSVSSALSPDVSANDFYNGDYLDQLLEGVYATDANGNVITTKTYTVTENSDENETGSFLQQVTQTVAENPEIVAAPSGLLALGGLLGFMMNKKHKDSLRLEEDETESDAE